MLFGKRTSTADASIRVRMDGATLGALDKGNEAAIAKAEQQALWNIPRADAVAKCNQFKHKFPFHGFVPCQEANVEFLMFSTNDDVVAWEYFWIGSYEPEMMSRFLAEVKKSKCFSDVGAYTGCYSIVAAKSGLDVHAIEMVPRTVERLKVNVYANNLRKQVKIYPYGVSNDTQTVDISMPRHLDFLGTGNSVNPKSHVDSVASTTCKLTTIDAWWEEAGRPKVDLMKIDVEEHEAEALEGAQVFFKHCRPTLFIEIEKKSYASVSSRLEQLGYELTQVKGLNYMAKAS